MNTERLVNKAEQRLYFLWRMRRAQLPSLILATFCRGTTESILTSNICLVLSQQRDEENAEDSSWYRNTGRTRQCRNWDRTSCCRNTRQDEILLGQGKKHLAQESRADTARSHWNRTHGLGGSFRRDCFGFFWGGSMYALGGVFGLCWHGCTLGSPFSFCGHSKAPAQGASLTSVGMAAAPASDAPSV